MSNYNKVILMGRIGKSLELKKSESGVHYAHISLATNVYRAKEEHTIWHRVVVFGTQAHACSRYLDKGSLVMIEGLLDQSHYIDKNGVKKYTTNVVASRVTFIGSGTMAKPVNGSHQATELEAYESPEMQSSGTAIEFADEALSA